MPENRADQNNNGTSEGEKSITSVEGKGAVTKIKSGGPTTLKLKIGEFEFST